ncbi:polysaccharide biosynthesis tyrosine autokinase [bacterium]|nr:polysaccharide biosynthesis tyrosine autokinase [bacterium]
MPVPQRSDEIHIGDYLSILYRRRFVALLAFLAVFVSVAIHTFLATPIYQASSTIQIKDQTKKSLLSELVQLDQTNTVAAEIEIIKSRSVAEQVVRNLRLDTVLMGFPYGVGLKFKDADVGAGRQGNVFTVTITGDDGAFEVSSKDGALGTGQVGKPFAADEDDEKRRVAFLLTGKGYVKGAYFRFAQQPFRLAVQNVMTKTDVAQVGDKTQILRVYYVDPSPWVAREVVNAVVETYQTRNIDENAKEARETLKFINSQLSLVQENLTGAEENLRDYKMGENTTSLGEETSALIDTYAQFALERSRIEIDERQYQAILAALTGGSEPAFGLPSLNMENTMLANLGLRLSELQTKKQELLSQYTESHPAVVTVRTQIEELGEKIREVVQNTLKTLAARKGEIDRVLDDLGEELKALPDKERRLAELIRAREVNQEIYTFLLQKREEARITEAATIGNIRVIDDAEMPLRPIKPNVRLNLMLGFVSGILLAIAVAFFLEFIDDSLKSTEEVERFITRPIYGIIPRIPEKRAPEPEAPPTPISANLVTHHAPKSPISEAFRTLRTNIHFADPDHSIREILVTSAGPSEGKSTIVSNLALTFANTGKRTVIVDCDLRKPNVHNFFDVSRDPGVTTILSGDTPWSEVARPTAIENMWVIPSGPIPPNPTEMLSSNAMKELVDTLRAEFDMVLLDSPPVVPVTDAAILASFVRATLLVVELGRSRASGVNRAIDLLDKVNANLLGLVTNNISAGYRYDYGYYQYYYYYGGDGQEKKRRKRRRGRYGY